MQRYIVTRVFYGIITLFVLSLVVFILARLTGNPLDVMLPLDSGPEARVIMSHELGLDKPVVVQFFIFIRDILKGDFGNSISQGKPALSMVLGRYPATVQLALVAFLVALAMGIPLGVLSAVKRGTAFDQLAKGFAILGQSMPVYWLGISLVILFSVRLGVLPASGREGIKSFILPAFCMGWFGTAALMRLLRSGMIDVLDSEYIKMARIKGVSERAIIWKHALRNGSLPALTLAGWMFASLLAGSVVTETVFAWPGVGQLAWQAIGWRDFPVIQTVILLIGTGFVVVNLVVDIIYAYLDPRIRYSK